MTTNGLTHDCWAPVPTPTTHAHTPPDLYSRAQCLHTDIGGRLTGTLTSAVPSVCTLGQHWVQVMGVDGESLKGGGREGGREGGAKEREGGGGRGRRDPMSPVLPLKRTSTSTPMHAHTHQRVHVPQHSIHIAMVTTLQQCMEQLLVSMVTTLLLVQLVNDLQYLLQGSAVRQHGPHHHRPKRHALRGLLRPCSGVQWLPWLHSQISVSICNGVYMQPSTGHTIVAKRTHNGPFTIMSWGEKV